MKLLRVLCIINLFCRFAGYAQCVCDPTNIDVSCCLDLYREQFQKHCPDSNDIIWIDPDTNFEGLTWESSQLQYQGVTAATSALGFLSGEYGQKRLKSVVDLQDFNWSDEYRHYFKAAWFCIILWIMVCLWFVFFFLGLCPSMCSETWRNVMSSLFCKLGFHDRERTAPMHKLTIIPLLQTCSLVSIILLFVFGLTAFAYSMQFSVQSASQGMCVFWRSNYGLFIGQARQLDDGSYVRWRGIDGLTNTLSNADGYVTTGFTTRLEEISESHLSPFSGNLTLMEEEVDDLKTTMEATDVSLSDDTAQWCYEDVSNVIQVETGHKLAAYPSIYRSTGIDRTIWNDTFDASRATISTLQTSIDTLEFPHVLSDAVKEAATQWDSYKSFSWLANFANIIIANESLFESFGLYSGLLLGFISFLPFVVAAYALAMLIILWRDLEWRGEEKLQIREPDPSWALRCFAGLWSTAGVVGILLLGLSGAGLFYLQLTEQGCNVVSYEWIRRGMFDSYPFLQASPEHPNATWLSDYLNECGWIDAPGDTSAAFGVTPHLVNYTMSLIREDLEADITLARSELDSLYQLSNSSFYDYRRLAEVYYNPERLDEYQLHRFFTSGSISAATVEPQAFTEQEWLTYQDQLLTEMSSALWPSMPTPPPIAPIVPSRALSENTFVDARRRLTFTDWEDAALVSLQNVPSFSSLSDQIDAFTCTAAAPPVVPPINGECGAQVTDYIDLLWDEATLMQNMLIPSWLDDCFDGSLFDSEKWMGTMDFYQLSQKMRIYGDFYSFYQIPVRAYLKQTVSVNYPTFLTEMKTVTETIDAQIIQLQTRIDELGAELLKLTDDDIPGFVNTTNVENDCLAALHPLQGGVDFYCRAFFPDAAMVMWAWLLCSLCCFSIMVVAWRVWHYWRDRKEYDHLWETAKERAFKKDSDIGSLSTSLPPAALHPLFKAIRDDDIVHVQQILEEDPVSHLVVDDEGCYALHVAVRLGDEGIVRMLLYHGANPNVKDTEGFTPLTLATAMDDDAIVGLLLINDGTCAMPSEPDAFGDTPLHIAAANGNCRVIQELLSRGADKYALNAVHETPMETALRKEQIEAADMLGVRAPIAAGLPSATRRMA